MNVTAKIALHLIPESLKSQPVFIRFAGIEISYYEQKLSGRYAATWYGAARALR